MDDARAEVERMAAAGRPLQEVEERIDDSFAMTERPYEGLAHSGLQQAEADAAFAAYDSATINRVTIYLRAVAAELDQVHPETDTPSERRERASGCLRKLKEAEWMLGNLADRP